MKPLYIKILIIFLINLTLYAQNSKGIVYYGQIESVTLKGPLGPDFNSYLVFNNEASYYTTAKDSLDKSTNFKRVYDNADGSRGLAMGEYTSAIGRQVYYNRKTDSISWNQWQTFYVKDKAPKINWVLDTITKRIGNYTVHKATTRFRGREYTAWYTIEIPLPYGPWKLHGLPGLILEAYDKHKEMFIYFKSLEYPTANTATVKPIIWPDDLEKKWRNFDDFKKRVDKIYERSRNSSIIIAQKLNSDVPEQQIKSEALLESF